MNARAAEILHAQFEALRNHRATGFTFTAVSAVRLWNLSKMVDHLCFVKSRELEHVTVFDMRSRTAQLPQTANNALASRSHRVQ